MTNFEIIHRANDRLQAVVISADDEQQAQERFVEHFESRGWVHGEIINVEEI